MPSALINSLVELVAGHQARCIHLVNLWMTFIPVTGKLDALQKTNLDL